MPLIHIVSLSGQGPSRRQAALARRFDDECREQIATNMSGRGLHIYPETKPTKCALSPTTACQSALAPTECCGKLTTFRHHTDLITSRRPVRIEKVGENQLVVHYEKDGEKLSMDAGLVLFGTGRKPNTDRLNLEARSSVMCLLASASLRAQA